MYFYDPFPSHIVISRVNIPSTLFTYLLLSTFNVDYKDIISLHYNNLITYLLLRQGPIHINMNVSDTNNTYSY